MDMPDSITDIANASAKVEKQNDVFAWENNLARELQNEKRSDDDELTPRSKQSNGMEINNYFDDDYLYKEEGDDQGIVSHENITLELDKQEEQDEIDMQKCYNAAARKRAMKNTESIMYSSTTNQVLSEKYDNVNKTSSTFKSQNFQINCQTFDHEGESNFVVDMTKQLVQNCVLNQSEH